LSYGYCNADGQTDGNQLRWMLPRWLWSILKVPYTPTARRGRHWLSTLHSSHRRRLLQRRRRCERLLGPAAAVAVSRIGLWITQVDSDVMSTFLLRPSDRLRNIVIVKRYCVRLCVCVCVCVCLSERISSEPLSRSLPNFCACQHVAYGRGSVLIHGRCDMLYTSGFVDDISCFYNGSYSVVNFATKDRFRLNLLLYRKVGHNSISYCIIKRHNFD